jgi:hypothetical protein
MHSEPILGSFAKLDEVEMGKIQMELTMPEFPRFLYIFWHTVYSDTCQFCGKK